MQVCTFQLATSYPVCTMIWWLLHCEGGPLAPAKLKLAPTHLKSEMQSSCASELYLSYFVSMFTCVPECVCLRVCPTTSTVHLALCSSCGSGTAGRYRIGRVLVWCGCVPCNLICPRFARLCYWSSSLWTTHYQQVPTLGLWILVYHWCKVFSTFFLSGGLCRQDFKYRFD